MSTQTITVRHADDLGCTVVNITDSFEIADNGDGTYDLYADQRPEDYSPATEPEFALTDRNVTLDAAIATVKHSVVVDEEMEAAIREAFRSREEFVAALRHLGATDAEIAELADTDLRDVIDESCLAHNRLSSLRRVWSA